MTSLKPLALDNHLESFILSFCKRRGFDYTQEEEMEEDEDTKAEEKRYSIHRERIVETLSKELANRCPTREKQILDVLTPLLNRQIRPKRFLNRNTSKCQWRDCTRNTPKKTNSVEETLILELYTKLLPFLTKDQAKVENFDEMERRIEAFVKKAVELSARRHDTKEEEAQKRVKGEFGDCCEEFKKDILTLVQDKKRFKEKVWKEGRMGENLKRIVLDNPGGRQTFCREHVREYKKFRLDGKDIPMRDRVTESDLTKRQEILFSKLFAFVKARLLPLTQGQGISEITVERNAFDVVPPKYRPHKERIGDKVVQKGLSEDKLGELYWYGPMYNFSNEREMFFEEFDGRCAYCNNSIDKGTYQIEHMFNRADFPLDSYLNKVPSCEACNRKKGNRTILEAGMPIHPEAYEAYEKYLEERKKKDKIPAHFLMNTKKGLLNLLSGVNGGFRGNQPSEKDPSRNNFGGPLTEKKLVRMMGRDLVSQARTQSSARMLGRYLATKLEDIRGRRPELKSFNSRYVAQIRSLLCPDFSKKVETKHGHALDAAILSCVWPSPNIPIPGRDGRERWEFDISWNRKLREKWPTNVKEDGRLELQKIVLTLQGFEEPLEKGGFFINLSNTNWNQREMSVTDQTIYCVKGERPTERKPARDWIEGLKDKDPEGKIKAIVHPNLRALLLEKFRQTPQIGEVEKAFKGWLRDTIKAGLKGPKPVHPSSQARWKELEKFAEGGEDIPPTVGLRLVQEKGIEYDPDIKRMEKGNIIHAHRAQPSYKYFLVAYNTGDSSKQKPLVLGVKQSWRVEVMYGDKNKAKAEIEGKACLKAGRPYRSNEKGKEFLQRWEEEINELLKGLGYGSYEDCYRISQGSVILYEDGRHFQLKNFKIKNRDNPWGRDAKTFCNVRQVYASPYRFLLKNAP
ncbi:MAG: HNH endonuclease domain-containing protein [Candidatus Brocadiales bacterium]